MVRVENPPEGRHALQTRARGDLLTLIFINSNEMNQKNFFKGLKEFLSHIFELIGHIWK